MAGPQQEWFTPEAMARLLTGEFTVTSRSNRMGLVLDGPLLPRAREDEFISDATTFGSIQVLPGGQPVVLMAEVM
ncbi:MAG: hypothetical protein M0Z31_10205 [Clostridia bacterium]|nr:hypothetical protein [Clostridia bacterium]